MNSIYPEDRKDDKNLVHILKLCEVIRGYEQLVEYFLEHWEKSLFNREEVIEVLEREEYNISKGARILKVKRYQLRYYVEKEGIKRPEKKVEYAGV